MITIFKQNLLLLITVLFRIDFLTVNSNYEKRTGYNTN